MERYLSRNILIISFALVLIVVIFIYFALPAEVAIHFNIEGNPDNYASREVFLIFLLAIVIFLNALMFSLPLLIESAPVSLINIPKKGYWLNEKNIMKTKAKMSVYFHQIGILTNFFLMFEIYLAYEANMKNIPSLNLSLSWISLIGFFVLLSGLLIMMYYDFNKIPQRS